MPEYEIKPGDWFAKIVKREGYGDFWRPIFSHAGNKAFRSECPDPNLLIPGKKCILPEKEGREESRQSDARSRFKKKAQKSELHLVILRPNGQALKSAKYKLVFHGPGVEGQTVEKKTDGSGAIKCEITPDVDSAILTIEGTEFELKIGHLEPVDTVKGVQARLQNLNYSIAAIDDGAGGAGSPTEAAIRAFQKNNSLADPEGVAEKATTDKLKQVYGC